MSEERTGMPPGYGATAARFDAMAAQEDLWLLRTGAYHRLVGNICRSLIPPGQRVLELGCGRGDLLASLEPESGVGVDVSPEMVGSARERHPELDVRLKAGESLSLGQTFDFILMTDLVPYVEDLQELFVSVARHSDRHTRVIVSTYSNLWRPLLAVLATLRLRPRRPIRNWVAPRDLENLMELAGLEVTTNRKEILVPTTIPVLGRLVNGYLARLPLLRSLTLTHWTIARPRRIEHREMTVSVVVPCRNEAGSIHLLAERIPYMGAGTEVVFVEGGSHDDTRSRIHQAIRDRPDRDLKLVTQTGTGKWNAVQEGFATASGEVLMILDGDMTVPPESLPKFYAAVAEGHGELINGSRLVYDLEPGAMRFLNMVGNRLFAGWLSAVLGQYVKDTLCGTKVVSSADLRRMQGNRHELGVSDPFGDFELLLGAALLGLKIINVPVRYKARVYGETNIRRFRHGATLARLAVAGYRRLWVRPVGR